MSADWGFLEIQGKEEHEEFAAESLAVSVQMAIQEVMASKGISQKALAERAGLSNARISQILSEHGRNLTLKTLGKIAYALEEDFEFIASRDLDHLRSQLQELEQRGKARRTSRRREHSSSQDTGSNVIYDILGCDSPWVDETANDNKFPWKQAA